MGETCTVSESTASSEGAEIRGAADQGHAPERCFPKCSPRNPRVAGTFQGPTRSELFSRFLVLPHSDVCTNRGRG